MKNVMNNTYLHAFITAVSAGVVFVLFIIICHIAPFGESTWLVYDMKRQYADFYSYYRTILSGDNNILYSPAIALGSGAVGFFTYYLSSPLLPILVFFDETKIPVAITLMIGIKLIIAAGCCDLFLTHYLCENEHTKENGSHPKTLVFALSYTYCAFIVSNCVNPMWLDVFALMPLVILMLDRLIEKKAKTGYIITLALMLWCNYYIAFMVCIFIVMWTATRLLMDKKEWIGKLIRVVICSFWAVCLDAVIMLPTILELIGSPKDIFILGLETTKGNLTIKDILIKMWFISYVGNDTIFGTPLIYAGTLTVFLVLLYLMNSLVKMKEKIMVVAMIAIFWISFAFDKVNLIWHAGMEPSGYPYREAFMYVFVCLICACTCFNKTDGIDVKRVFISGAVMAALFVYSLRSRHECIDTRFIVANSILIATVFVLVLLYVIFTTKGRFPRTDITQKIAKAILVMLICVQTGELLLNSWFVFAHETIINMDQISEYEDTVSKTRTAALAAKQDNGFYRMENMDPREQNDDMMYDYNGVTHYSSAGLLETRYFLQKMGFNDDGLYTDYGHDNTYTADSLLGIKYLISADGYRDGYEKIDDEGKSLYRNPYALSVASLTDEMPGDIDLPSFELQERLYENINSEHNEIFKDDIVWSERFARDGLPYMCYLCRAQCDGYVYVYIDEIEEYRQYLEIYEEDRFVDIYGNNASYKILNLGYHNKDDLFDVYVRTDVSDAHFGTAYIVSEDTDALKAAYESARVRDCEVKKLSSSRFEITLPEGIETLQGSGVITTFPYERGWKVKVNGKRIEPKCAYQTFLFIPTGEVAGGSVIEISYHPEGMAEGLIISAIAVIGIVLLHIIDKRKSKEC